MIPEPVQKHGSGMLTRRTWRLSAFLKGYTGSNDCDNDECSDCYSSSVDV